MKIDVNAEGASVDATTEELGEVAGALGILDKAPSTVEQVEMPYVPADEETAIAEEMVATDIADDTSMVGEPSDPMASAKGKFSAWAARNAVKGLRTDVTPGGGMFDTMWKAQQKTGTEPEPIPQTPLEMLSNKDYEGLAQRIADSSLDQYDDTQPHQPNFNTYESDEIAATHAAFSEHNKAEIDLQRRGNDEGVLTDEELRKLAQTVREDPEFLRNVLQMEPGTVLKPEELLALNQTIGLLLRDLNGLAKKGVQNWTPQERQKAEKIEAMANALIPKKFGARAEQGRGLRASGMDVEGTEGEMYGLMQQAENGLSFEARMEMYGMANSNGEMADTVKAVRPNNWRVTYDTMHEVFVNGILSGLKTHLVNGLGGWLKIGVNVADTAMAARMGTGGELDPTQVIQVGEWKAYMAGLSTGWREALDVAVRAGKTGERYGNIDKMEDQATRTAYGTQDPLGKVNENVIQADTYGLDPEGFWGKNITRLGHVINAPTKNIMGATDAFNKKLAERASIVQSAYRYATETAEAKGLNEAEGVALFKELVENPTEEIKEIALEHGLDATFQTDLNDFGKNIQRFTSMRGINAIVPFFKTPANILKEAYIDRTVLGMLTDRYRDAIKAGGKRAQMARAKVVNGMMLYTSAAGLAMSGMVTGGYSRDPDIRNAQRESEWKPYSFVTENADGTKSYFSFQRLEPFSYIFGVAADIAQLNKEMEYQPLTEDDEARVQRIASAAVMAVAENTLNKSFMKGLNEFMEVATSGSQQKVGWWVKNFVNSRLPYSGLRRDLDNLINEDKQKYMELWDYIADQHDIIWKNTPNDVDIIGRDTKRDYKFIPWLPSKGKWDNIYHENQRLAEITRNSAIKRIPYSWNGVKFNQQQYHDVMKYSRTKAKDMEGNTFAEKIRDTIKSRGYKKASPDRQSKILRSIQRNYDNMAYQWLMDTDREFDEAVKKSSASSVVKERAFQNGTNEDAEWQKLKRELSSFNY